MSQSSKLTAAVTAAAFVLAGQAASADMMTSIGQGEGEVSIVAWPGYIERGESDKNYDWVTGFEKETGCKVTVKTAGSSDEMVSLMNAGGFDLVTASGDATLRLIAGNTVQEINISLITDWNKIDPNLQSGPWHTVNGKHYGVPWQWGPNVLMYNAGVFENAPQSWSVVFEEQKLPDGKSNKGRVEAYYGPIYIADAALYLMTNKPELGIQDPYALTKPQFDAAVDLLRQQRQIVNKYWGDAAAQVDDFTSEGVVAA
ncbi:MAG TPA: extracellular solute-binding protein, partial [Dongiaceae bacterium]